MLAFLHELLLYSEGEFLLLNLSSSFMYSVKPGRVSFECLINCEGHLKQLLFYNPFVESSSSVLITICIELNGKPHICLEKVYFLCLCLL